MRRFERDVGLVLGAFALLLAFENVAIGLGYRAEFAGTWEMASARRYLTPIGLALSLPMAIALAALRRLAWADRAPAVGIVGGLAGAALGFGISTGRHLDSLAIRIPFVVLLAAGGFLLTWRLAAFSPRADRRVLAPLGLGIGALAWLADAFVLTRLYPALHLALFFIALAGFGCSALLLSRARLARPLAAFAIVVTSGCIAWSPDAARFVRAEDNLRRILLEHAPFLGRAVVAASRLAPPLPLEEDEGARATLTSLRSRGGARALDWKGHDIIVVTIDALRADHVGAYGYPRPTTPNIDALAARGVRFDHAYCPTPHTSYSIASMMTGKYMKPLLALDTEDDSETWPVQLRRYGYKTAAFYPPAVFFIDEHRFRALHDDKLGFEYAKEEFTKPELLKAQIEEYLRDLPRESPLFLWVHLFEPHEPYEMHPEHEFTGDARVDAYDSEVAAADAFVGEVAKLVAAHRPRAQEAVFIVSADHGEEHGDHGGRYHGTTVYEEQVRVPLVVAAPGLHPHVVDAPAQTIDLLPTSLAALDVPIPPRIRGRDLGPALAGLEPKSEQGLAFAETDDYTLVARGSDRLVCARRIGSCTLFDVKSDPGEVRPLTDRTPRVDELKKLTAALERETGKLEASALPEALRRGMQGDRDAAEDVAPLLDDARVDIRRAAARCAFRLQAPEIAPQVRRAFGADEDGEVRQWAALALVRMGDASAAGRARGTPGAVAESLLKSKDDELRVAAAIALAEREDGRGESELLARWTEAFAPQPTELGELAEARELLAALTKIHSRNAVPVLAPSLVHVRLRPYIVETLAALGDFRAREPLLRTFSQERYVNLRGLEARALVKLGARERLLTPLSRFAGTPEPLPDAIVVARDAHLLTPERGGREWAPTANGGETMVAQTVKSLRDGPARLFVLGAVAPKGEDMVRGDVGGTELTFVPLAETGAIVYAAEISTISHGDVRVTVTYPGGVLAAWLVPRADEIPPPAPEAWHPDGGL